ncbi:DUF2897 family protein [Shewanella sp. NIFS-20-20]|uniref:DUF2897 family protein n=1 Tax=Shewanella sp. NIFS-20-20 TaxID=2853806 RepID=UPI001C44F1D8|nr:DUF2897 family protein [Shewanella sp. NIFS-20-20]MBV7317029.1 DUF2897 family protein [Shewanella sp. NIFS-20-20]
MSDLEVILIIVLVIGVIISNLAVLKYSAKFKMSQFGHKSPKVSPKEQGRDSSDDDTLPKA